ncbi:MAG TPA: hypothetical protein VM121_09085 [Acidimicrobiales bacterium]|nr:hypothetical protein [Acidimicrobiales bacterium]
MDAAASELLSRARLSVVDGRFELHLDGWPLLLVDIEEGTVGVNDLRAATMFAADATLPSTHGHLCMRAGVVGDELYLLVGEAAAVFLVPDAHRATHVEVKVVESATGRLLLDRIVRYRQMPVGAVAVSPAIRRIEG